MNAQKMIEVLNAGKMINLDHFNTFSITLEVVFKSSSKNRVIIALNALF